MKKIDAKAYTNNWIIREALQHRDPMASHRTKNRMRLAARILDILEKKGWKKKDLAEKLNKKPSEISRWVSGTHNLSLDLLSDIEFVTGEPILIPYRKEGFETVKTRFTASKVEWVTKENAPSLTTKGSSPDSGGHHSVMTIPVEPWVSISIKH